jgi:carbamoyl-phosphate synthase large subunit
VRALRHKLGVRPVFKRIDTCAAEFEAKTPYMYSTYEAPSFGEPECESAPTDREKGRHSGRRAEPDRAGDRVRLLLLPRLLRARRGGYETIMVNCNPETVSTDYDTSDRLYFEPLTARMCWNPAGRTCRTAR